MRSRVANRAELAAEIAEARRSLVSTLKGLRPEDWEAPSLCSEWAVRDVVGHIVHLFRLNVAPYRLAGLSRYGLRVNRFLSEEARGQAKGRQFSELMSDLEAARFEQTWIWQHYPYRAYALSEFVVHAQDIRRPLGISDAPTTRQLEVVANLLARPPRTNLLSRVFIAKLPSTRFEATDSEWSFGDGPVARGPLEAIVMVIAGRGQALAGLSGEGVNQLREVLG